MNQENFLIKSKSNQTWAWSDGDGGVYIHTSGLKFNEKYITLWPFEHLYHFKAYQIEELVDCIVATNGLKKWMNSFH